MSQKTISQEILIITNAISPNDGDLDLRDGRITPHLPNLASVDITNLQGQVNIFIQQLDQIMSETPEKVGGFRLDEFEVSAGIVVEAKGGVRLALLANAEIGGGVNAGLKFVFKRS